MAKALKHFVIHENEGHLPLPGVLPDMTANTDSYIALQHIYRQQALQDADQVYHKCQEYLKQLALPADSIDERSVRLICKEAAGLAVIRGTRIAEEYEKSSRLLPLGKDLSIYFGTTLNDLPFLAFQLRTTSCRATSRHTTLRCAPTSASSASVATFPASALLSRTLDV